MFLEAGVMSLVGVAVGVASTLPDKRIATAVRIAVLNIVFTSFI